MLTIMMRLMRDTRILFLVVSSNSVLMMNCLSLILRDTGATQTLLVADESSLGTTNFTGKNVLIQDVNDSYKPVPLYNIELNSLLVSGAVTVGIVAELPMRGISLLLGNDLARGKVLPSPIVCDSPVEDSVTETLEKDIPGIFPLCEVTRAQAMKENEKDDEDDGEVMLGATFFRELNESRKDAFPTETVFSQPVLIEAQEEAEDLKRPPHRIKPAPLIPIPVSQEPFSHVLIECVVPETKSGFQVVSDVFHGDVKCANSNSCEVEVVHVQDDVHVHSDAHSSPDLDLEAEMNPRVEISEVMSNPEMLLNICRTQRGEML